MPERDGYIPGVPCWVDTAGGKRGGEPWGGAGRGVGEGRRGDERVGTARPRRREGGCEGGEPGFEERTPGLRQQVAQMGGPEGFIDVVAALNPIAADDSATPAHWSVTFAVDDAESTAAKSRELGGQVVSGPFDAPWTRMAVIKDPQGATFIASQFVPENKDPGA